MASMQQPQRLSAASLAADTQVNFSCVLNLPSQDGIINSLLSGEACA